jgi:diguanylate cyclase (GGDEF)-like protein
MGRRVDDAQLADGSRQAAWLFMAAGLIGLVNDLPGTIGQGRAIAVELDALNFAIGIAARLVPWHRWSPRATLLLPALALANMSVNISNNLLPVSTYGVWLVLVFVWIGQWQPSRTAFAMGPVAALAYLLPFAFGTPATATAVGSIAISVPVAMLVAETIARKEKATQLAQAGQHEAFAILAAANLTDDLTGLGNRRRANVLLDSLGEGDALAILDLDHFKRVNDNLGHQRGDEVLQELGNFLRNAIRGGDSVARFGGEEFVVVLRSSTSSAPATIQRLLADWRTTGPLTTLSAGLAVHRAGQSSDVTFGQADAALYRAKQGGRDRLVVELDSVTPSDRLGAHGKR